MSGRRQTPSSDGSVKFCSIGFARLLMWLFKGSAVRRRIAAGVARAFYIQYAAFFYFL